VTVRAEEARDAWPSSVLDAPLLRGLDARALREIALAGKLISPADGGLVYRAGDAGESFFVVANGRVHLSAIRRGDDRESELRVAGPGETFGEESTVGLPRRATAIAEGRCTIAEVPVALFRRVAARAGTADIAARIERSLQRAATRDLLGTLALTRDLPPRAIDILLDAITHHRFERGQAIYRSGDRTEGVWLVADGLVQLQTDDGDRLHVKAYLSRGDFFGDEEISEGPVRPRDATAIASGPSLLLAIPTRVFQTLVADYAEIRPHLARIGAEQRAAERAIVGRAAQNATQHLFRDLYRLQVARSLLVIDLDTCVRCGHCAWACSSLYGDARLVRRGDKVVARVDERLRAHGGVEASAPQSLLLPSSCQHCENPACMVDCPTGAIGRDASGEVFIRDALCTGCSACAKACPWDNIQMTARPSDVARPGGGEYPELAVKCDLCRTYEAGPACVQACPTESIFRINPSEEIADVRALFDVQRGAAFAGPTKQAPLGAAGAVRSRPAIAAGGAIAATGIALVGLVMQSRGAWIPAHGIGFVAGVTAAIGMLALTAYAVPKRLVRLWMGRRKTTSPEAPRVETKVRSRVAPHVAGHLALGFVTAAVALGHAPPSSHGLGRALLVALLVSSAAGALTALTYALVPARLSRLERQSALPEDFGPARALLVDRLYQKVSGKSDLVKKIFETMLLPYAKSFFGPALLIASGRRLREEEQRLETKIETTLEGRGKERLAGLSDLVRIVVELRALPAQRALLFSLRVFLPLHVLTFVMALALLIAHVVTAIAWRGA
jgi:Fe-S-cluster-containing dehydrogenase component/CRP-like cAMP-binding protein